jgi:uncharacterized membrane protein
VGRYGLLDVCVEVISEEAWSAGRAPKKTINQQVVVIISILSHPINQGYDVHRLAHLTEFNGEKVCEVVLLSTVVIFES